MLNQPTIEKLQAMKLHGMAEAFQEQIEIPESSELSFEERLGLLVDRQWTWKEARALTRRLQVARFKERGVMEDINYQHPRGLDRKLIRTLATSDWFVSTKMSCWLGQPILRHSAPPRYIIENTSASTLKLQFANSSLDAPTESA